MAPDIPALLRALADRKLISNPVEFRPFAGNADRKSARARWHVLVRPEFGPSIKLTVARDLASIVARSRRFAAAFPALTPREVFSVRVGDWDVWATAAVDGPLFEQLDIDSAAAARMCAGLATIDTALREAEEPSDAAALAAEWNSFRGSLLDLAVWTAEQRAFLMETLLPKLGARLGAITHTRRWSNGDLTSTNLCLAAGEREQPIIFDAEFASNTHFFAEEHVRFRRISPLCHRHPALLDGWWGRPDPAWEVYFQLRQLLLEDVENTLTYVQGAIGPRLAAVRCFGEPWIGRFPADWPASVSPLPVVHPHASETVQLFWRNEHEAFTEERSRRIVVPTRSRQLVCFRVPGPFPFWRLDPVATERPFWLHSLTPVHGDPAVQTAPLTTRFENTRVESNDKSSRVHPTGPDPQIHFALPAGALGLVVELSCD